MKILYISCGSGADPTVGGSLERTRQIAKRIIGGVLTTSAGVRHFPNSVIHEIKTPVNGYNMGIWYIPIQLYSYLCVWIQSLIIKLPDFDLVYIDSDGLWDIIPALIYKSKHPKTKIVSMNHHLSSTWFNRIHQWLSHKIIRRISTAVLLLDTPSGYKLGWVIGHQNVMYVKNGIDKDLIDSVPEQPKKYKACFFGTPRPNKGLFEIVPLWDKVRKAGDELIIIGDVLPIYRKHLAHPTIKIMGYIPDKREAIKLVKQCECFISPCKDEGWGIAVRECIYCGLKGIKYDTNIPNPSWDEVAKEERKLYEDIIRYF